MEHDSTSGRQETWRGQTKFMEIIYLQQSRLIGFDKNTKHEILLINIRWQIVIFYCWERWSYFWLSNFIFPLDIYLLKKTNRRNFLVLKIFASDEHVFRIKFLHIVQHWNVCNGQNEFSTAKEIKISFTFLLLSHNF